MSSGGWWRRCELSRTSERREGVLGRERRRGTAQARWDGRLPRHLARRIAEARRQHRALAAADARRQRLRSGKRRAASRRVRARRCVTGESSDASVSGVSMTCLGRVPHLRQQAHVRDEGPAGRDQAKGAAGPRPRAHLPLLCVRSRQRRQRRGDHVDGRVQHRGGERRDLRERERLQEGAQPSEDTKLERLRLGLNTAKHSATQNDVSSRALVGEEGLSSASRLDAPPRRRSPVHAVPAAPTTPSTPPQRP